MDYESKILLNRLVGEVEKLNSPDWWVIGITLLGMLISGFLSFILYKLTKKIGEHQNILQQNNLRIQMHQKYFEIYDAFSKDWQSINNLTYQFAFALDGIVELGLCNSKVQDVLDIAKVILPPKDYGNLIIFLSDYTGIRKMTMNMFSFVEGLDNETRIVLKDTLKKEGLLCFILEMYEKTNYKVIENYLIYLRRITDIAENELKKNLRSYTDLSDIIKTK